MKKAILSFVFLCLCAPFARGQGVNRISNPSFEVADPDNSNLAASWWPYGAPYTRVRTFNVWDQNYVIQLRAGQGAVQSIFLYQTTAKPVRISARIKGENIINDPADKLGVSIDCKVYYTNGEFAWCPTTQVTKNTGTFDWTWVGYNTETFNILSLRNKIARIDVRFTMGNVAGTAWVDDVHLEEYTMALPGMISFCFHDSLLSAYTKAYPLLKSYGYVGSVAAVTGYIGKDSNHMTLAQHQELYRNGWPILSHSVNHLDMTKLGTLAVNDELYWSHKYLADNGMPTKHFVFPFGAYNGPVMSRVQAEWYGNLPYISAQVSQALNLQGMFPYNVGVYSIKSETTVEQVNQMLALYKAFGGFLVFVVHDIDNPGYAPWNVSLNAFKQMLDAVWQSGLPVVSYEEGFSRVTRSQ